MKKVAIYLSFLLFIISLFGCRESTTTPIEPTDTGLKLKKAADENSHLLYKYDNNKMVSIDVVMMDTTQSTIKIYYNGNGKVIRRETIIQKTSLISEYSLFEYDANNKLIGEKNYQSKSDGTFELRDASRYECDNEGRVIKAYDAVTNMLTCALSYDNNGNVTEIKSFKDGQIIAKDTFEYDSGLNPFISLAPFTVLAAEASSKNNVIKRTYVGYNSVKKDEMTLYNLWKYNSKNYPIDCSYNVSQVFGSSVDNYSGYIEYEYY